MKQLYTVRQSVRSMIMIRKQKTGTRPQERRNFTKTNKNELKIDL